MIVLDTNIISELMKKDCDTTVQRWLDNQLPESLFVTAITVSEIHYGINILPTGLRKSKLRQLAEQIFDHDFKQRILPYGYDEAVAYAKIVAERKLQGNPIGVFDAMIAACALKKNAVVATRDLTGFEIEGLLLINPFSRSV